MATTTTAKTTRMMRLIVQGVVLGFEVAFRSLAQLFELVEVDEALDLICGPLREIQEPHAVGEALSLQIVERDHDLAGQVELPERRRRRLHATPAFPERG